MRYGIVGSREFTDYSIVQKVLDEHNIYIVEIVSGGARGADSLAARYAEENAIVLVEFLPDYDKYGKKAPFVRNKLIVDNSDIIIAFWNGISRGTKHSIDYATSKKKKVIIVPVD
jgi:predicted Rossmann fold nucleotide-binding protein DprA/Smf involved in DNA uptake